MVHMWKSKTDESTHYVTKRPFQPKPFRKEALHIFRWKTEL